MQAQMKSEQVMVVPSNLLEPLFTDESFITGNIPGIIEMVKKNHLYISREYAEHAVEYKQVIPYAVLMNGSDYFLTKRLKKQTEKRLHGMYSIGLGGHINPQEEQTDDAIIAGLRRELYEEAGLRNFQIRGCAGIINDHAADVSNFHIGLVYPLMADRDIQIREVSKMTGEWASQEEINFRFDEMESWSQIVWKNRALWASL